MIMAYDFSKAKGNPGPNFPLNSAEDYGYDYKKMTEDFLQVVPAEKISVVFGLFGYDWLVDDKNKSLQQAKSLSTSEIENKFIDTCAFRSCSFSRDSKSNETEIHYKDLNDSNHIIWFEDIILLMPKRDILKNAE